MYTEAYNLTTWTVRDASVVDTRNGRLVTTANLSEVAAERSALLQALAEKEPVRPARALRARQWLRSQRRRALLARTPA